MARFLPVLSILFFTRKDIQPIFQKTNLPRFAVSWVNRREKASFLGLISTKIRTTKEKERRKRKSEGKKGGEEKKSNDCTISFCNGYIGDCFRSKTNCWTRKVHLAVTFSKIRLEDLICKMSNVCHLKLPKMAHFQRLAKFFGNI